MDTQLWLFSYGTLRDPAVQSAVFGRPLDGMADMLAGWRIEPVAIADEDVVRLSGLAVHDILRFTGDPADRVAGTALGITPADVAKADAYEVASYHRVAVTLRSGRRAFVYVGD